MVITQIHSGLGNQMFQYAAGVSLAHHLKVPCKLDITWFEHSATAQTPNDYQLNVFPGIHEAIANKPEIDALIRPSSEGWINRIKHKINRNRPVHRRWAFEEPHFHFYPQFFEAKSPVFITGYWQCERYFLPVADKIRQIFSLDFLPDDPNSQIAAKIRAANAVSLHVRRGDMVKNPEVAAKHGSCNLDYYQRAMRMIEKEVEHPVYFVFSDDLEWCRENLVSDHPMEFISGNHGAKAIWDIQLMRLCKHHIIANSSFSWWGAWLNASPVKIVIAPIRWFNNANHDTRDLLPLGWRTC